MCVKKITFKMHKFSIACTTCIISLWLYCKLIKWEKKTKQKIAVHMTEIEYFVG